MNIKKFHPEAFAYGVPSQYLFPWEGVADTPFGSMWCLVPPGETVKAHKHHEGETYIVAYGRGEMEVDGERVEVGPGDAVYMDPFHTHTMRNTSGSEDLLFLAVWWEDMRHAAGHGEQLASERHARRPKRVLITATPPTPNGDLHVGHLSGPYLGADVHRRYLQMRGVEVRYVSGADDHQSYVPLKAHRMGTTPREVADRFAGQIEETLASANIELDLFVRPKTSAHHVEVVRKFYRALYDKGAFVAREKPGLWCATCEKYLFEAHVSGKCPHCGAGSDGSACEQCGWPNDCVDLVDPVCKYCGGKPATRPFRRLYFPLDRYREQLREHYRSVRMSAHLRSLCLQMVEDLPEIAVSHVADWGIPVPVPGFEDQRIYVWMEMAPGFLAATEELLAREAPGASWEDWWKDGEHALVQFFGFDNGYFHGVLFPALWIAYDPAINLARSFVTNEFLRLDGAKFSTSRGHAIWGQEILQKVPADVLRFYLAWSGPEREQTNFTLAGMEETVGRELVERWQAWLRDLGARVERQFGGVAPWSGAWTDEHEEFFLALKGTAAEVAASYEAESFSPGRAVRQLAELVRLARRFAQAESYWARVPKGKEELRNAFALELAAARALALLAAPVMPGFSARLWQALGYEAPAGPLPWEEVPQFLPGGQRVSALAGFEIREGRTADLQVA